MLVVLADVELSTGPPEAPAYQLKVPEEADVATSVTVPFPQRDTLGAVGCAGIVLMVAVTEARALLTQVPLSNST